MPKSLSRAAVLSFLWCLVAVPSTPTDAVAGPFCFECVRLTGGIYTCVSAPWPHGYTSCHIEDSELPCIVGKLCSYTLADELDPDGTATGRAVLNLEALVTDFDTRVEGLSVGLTCQGDIAFWQLTERAIDQTREMTTNLTL